MEQNPFPHRKSTRIPNYDYSGNNYYFVTICTNEKKCLFGEPNQLSTLGKIAKQDLITLENHYNGIRVDVFTVMPNHIHAIIAIEDPFNQITISTIIGQYKSGVSRKAKMISVTDKIWQRSFHDHVIRNQASYEKIWNYIIYNHQKWEEDCFFVRK